MIDETIDPSTLPADRCRRCGAQVKGRSCENCTSYDAVGNCEFCGQSLRRDGSCNWDSQHRRDPQWRTGTATRGEYEPGTRLRVKGDDGIETVSYRRSNRGVLVVERRGREFRIDPSQIVGLAR